MAMAENLLPGTAKVNFGNSVCFVVFELELGGVRTRESGIRIYIFPQNE